MTRRTPKPSNVTPLTTRHGVILSTGEVVDVDFPATRGRRRKSRVKVYALVDLDALDRLELYASEWRVLHRVMRGVARESNDSRLHLVEIATDLHLAPSAVSRAMKELRVRKIVRTRAPGVHYVNPHIMFRGSNQDWDDATDTTPEPIWRRSS